VSKLTDQYPAEMKFLNSNIDFSKSDSEYYNLDEFLLELLNDVEDQGHYELPGKYTHSRNPVVYEGGS